VTATYIHPQQIKFKQAYSIGSMSRDGNSVGQLTSLLLLKV